MLAAATRAPAQGACAANALASGPGAPGAAPAPTPGAGALRPATDPADLTLLLGAAACAALDVYPHLGDGLVQQGAVDKLARALDARTPALGARPDLFSFDPVRGADAVSGAILRLLHRVSGVGGGAWSPCPFESHRKAWRGLAAPSRGCTAAAGPLAWVARCHVVQASGSRVHHPAQDFPQATLIDAPNTSAFPRSWSRARPGRRPWRGPRSRPCPSC